MKNLQRHKKLLSIIGLCVYLLVYGYSIFHYHSTNYLINEAFSAPAKTVQDSKFHYEGFCLLHHFNATQFSIDGNPFPHFAPAKIYLNVKDYTSIPISSEINSVLKRGPPTLS